MTDRSDRGSERPSGTRRRRERVRTVRRPTRGLHQGQRPCAPREKAGHMVCTRPGRRHAEPTPCTAGAVHTWFHVAMRLRHAKRAAEVLSTGEPGRLRAKAVVVAEIERLHWRIWNGKAKDARLTIGRIREVMHVFKGERRSEEHTSELQSR